MEGALVGLAGAAIGAGIWFAVAALVHREVPPAAVLVGILAGQGVLAGARRTGPITAVIAAVWCLVVLGVAEYFVSRTVAVHAQPTATIPLWQGFGFARQVVSDGVRHSVATAAAFGVAVVFAVAGAGFPNRRPVI